MAQRQVTTVLQMLAQRQAVQVHTQAQTQVQAQVQVQPQVQPRKQHNPYQSTVQPLTFAELAARQKATAPVASVKVQKLLVQQQQAEQEQVVQPQTAQPPAYAVNPYLDPDVEMPPPEPFDISSLDYADHPPINPLAGAQHASKVNDPVYDQVYL